MQKVAVVTGSAKGLGREIALFLAKKGYKVVVHYRKSLKAASDVVKAVQKISADSIKVSADLTFEEEVEKTFATIIKKYKRVDILVNNVGNFIHKSFNKTTNSEFRDILESNIYSTLFCSRAVLPIMRRQKSGHIINIGAVGAERFTFRKSAVPYFLAKNGVYVLTKTMANEEAHYGIHINMVSPASLVNDIFDKKDFPMGRSAKYEDVIKAIEFLISPKAYYINGANIEVSGAFIAGVD